MRNVTWKLQNIKKIFTELNVLFHPILDVTFFSPWANHTSIKHRWKLTSDQNPTISILLCSLLLLFLYSSSG